MLRRTTLAPLALFVLATACMGQSFSYEATFDAVQARYVRVCGLKPDGPDQPGTQMSIAELEVYE